MQLLHRKIDAHKGNFGHILILAGSMQYSGAALLCSHAALRAGAGIVSLGIPHGIGKDFVKKKIPEVILYPLAQTEKNTLSVKAYPQIKRLIERIDVFVVGPGLSQNNSTQKLIRKMISNINKPMVIDADGLNALVGYEILLKRMPNLKILTPHPGEMGRLLNITAEKVQQNREKIALKFALEYNCILILKGFNTVVADSKGSLYSNKTGNPGLATAGSGDVLSGIIAAFLAQGLSGFDAAKYAVYIHGLAGDLAAKEKTQLCMIASDIIDTIHKAVKKTTFGK